MSDDGSVQSNNEWPLPKFYFDVDFGDGSGSVSFHEVSGLDNMPEPIEFRTTNSPLFSTIKMPGVKKYGNVTMKKGVFTRDNKFWDWYDLVTLNTINRKTVTIKLMDETGAPTMTWTLANAYPIKVTGTDIKNEDNEVAIKSIEIVHEGLTITNG